MELWIAIGLDILAAAVIVIPLIYGISRGFRRQALSLISLAVASVISFVASTLLVTPMYDNYFKSDLISACVKASARIDPIAYANSLLAENGVDVSEEELRGRLAYTGNAIDEARSIAEEKGLTPEKAQEIADKMSSDYLANAPEEVRSAVPKVLRRMNSTEIDEAQLTDLINAAAASPEEGGAYVEENFVRPTVKALLKSVIFAVIYAIVQLLMLLIFFIFGFDVRAHAQGAGDRLGGFALGFISAAGNLAILCIIMSGIEKASLGFFEIETLPSKVFLPIFNILF